MPLPLPRLDSHRFEQLVEEGTALLQRLAPGWTDYNLHDPGITLMELLAWLVETDIYRLDRTSQAAFRAFLRLVGIQLRQPSVAKTVLVFNIADDGVPMRLSAGAQVSNREGDINFQTSRYLFVSSAKLESVQSGADGSLKDHSAENKSAGKGFPPFGMNPLPGNVLSLFFDRAPLISEKDEVSLYVWTQSLEQDDELADRLIREYEMEQIALDACERQVPCPRPDWRQHYSVRTQWEYFSQQGTWLPVIDPQDETRGFTLSGAVRFKLPVETQQMNGEAGQFMIRCRMVSGYYECPPQIQMIALNAVSARNVLDITIEEKQKDGNGCAGQTFQLANAPVVSGSTCLRVTVNGQEQEWQEASTWDQVRPHDRKYVLSPESGQIIFGNGLHGCVPKSGSKIAAHRYQKGGGVSGNVRANTLTCFLGSEKVVVTQPFAAFGGAQAEALNEAKARAIQWLNKPQRAVTLDDFEKIALATPGVPIQRAHAIADHDPALPGLPALGSVTVVIVPSCDNPVPEAGPDMLRAVKSYLERRRMLTTELHVVSPGFVTIAVRAMLHSTMDADASALQTEANRRLNIFLDPLRGGPDGQGWPFGRDVYESEIMALLNAIPAVDHVDQVGLEIESRLSVYQGYITWMRVFESDGSSIVLRVQLRSEERAPASRLTLQAQGILENYFHSSRGRSKHISQESRRKDVAALLSNLPGLLHVEQVRLDERSSPTASCGNVSLCAQELVLPGRHQIKISGARNNQSMRAAKPPC